MPTVTRSVAYVTRSEWLTWQDHIEYVTISLVFVTQSIWLCHISHLPCKPTWPCHASHLVEWLTVTWCQMSHMTMTEWFIWQVPITDVTRSISDITRSKWLMWMSQWLIWQCHITICDNATVTDMTRSPCWCDKITAAGCGLMSHKMPMWGHIGRCQ